MSGAVRSTSAYEDHSAITLAHSAGMTEDATDDDSWHLAGIVIGASFAIPYLRERILLAILPNECVSIAVGDHSGDWSRKGATASRSMKLCITKAEDPTV